MVKKIWSFLFLGFLVFVIIISLVNLGMKLTGKVTNAGVINVTIETKVNINFSDDSISFGSGAVTIGEENATIDSTGNVTKGNWTPVSGGFVIENTGSVNITLNLKSNNTASEFLGGTDPAYRYNVTNIESNSCNSSGFNLGEWYDVNTSGTGTLVCDLFEYVNSRDSIRVDIQLIIPSDSLRGSRQSTFTATATAI